MRAKRAAGKRIAAAGRRRGKPSVPRTRRPAGRRTEEKLTGKQRWQLTQLVISGSLFVLLVAVTWFLPGGAERLNAPLTDAIHRNMDVQAVFSAVGRVFADGTSEAGNLYQAVFGPEEAEQVAEVRLSNVGEAAAWEMLRKNRREPSADAETPAGEAEASPETLAYILYSGQTLPENVSMEQTILGFDYCTPVRGNLSSDFGYRDHPTEGEARFHYGVDLAADTGTEVCCFADGNVTAVGESSSYGKYCIVTHEKGFRTLYAHCSRITVSSGAAVQGGGKIAEVGETGMATGPHLHFELQREGTYLNPVYYLDLL